MAAGTEKVPRGRSGAASGRVAEAAVAAHYDELDGWYRAIWGPHLHHGLWSSPAHSPEEATAALVGLVAERAGLDPGMSVCDVGCGYGETARVLARRHGVGVTALTLSRAQHDYARAREGESAGVEYVLASWLRNGLPDATFDAVIAIESLSHMDDGATAFAECARVLRPGGRLVACDWLSGDAPRAWERRLLLDPIRREGRLAFLCPAAEYGDLIASAGLATRSFEDLSRRVRRTWWICLRRTARELARNPAARRFVLDGANANRDFALSLVRIPLAYLAGAMRYGLFTAVKAR
jgi:tocopherol O-methyltransferase